MSNITNIVDIPAMVPLKAAIDGRTLWDIVRGCLATLFACLWVSVHPNMSSTSHSDFRVFVKRVELMIWTLLFPEMIILWAFRQWSGARALCMKYKGYSWTMGHGFLLQMGGFVEKCEDGHVHALRYSGLEKWILQHKRVPIVTGQQITARSKSDGLSKGLILIQTSWFIVQCIARRIEGLIITPAELSTLAFAVLNSVMYFLWWHKPLDCRIPVELHVNYPGYPKTILTVELLSDVETTRDDNEAATEPLGTSSIVSHSPSSGSISRVRYIDPDEGLLRRILLFPYRRLSNMRTSISYARWGGSHSQVSMFYAYTPRGKISYYKTIREDLFFGHIVIGIVCLAFGGMHILAWSSEFPSRTEGLLWRICSVAITALPVIYVTPILLLQPFMPSGDVARGNLSIANKLVNVSRMFQLAIPPVYFLA